MCCLLVCTQVTKSQKDTGSNHAISALKFGIIKKFLQLGWAVLLSDIDVAVLQDPFKFLYRWVKSRGWYGCLSAQAYCQKKYSQYSRNDCWVHFAHACGATSLCVGSV
jgi:hypothetical protein